jgi:hypothetical protein
MCVVWMDNKWIGLDTALKVQAVLFEMQFMMGTGLLSEWHQAVQQLGESFCRATVQCRTASGRDCIGVPLPWGVARLRKRRPHLID